MPTSEAKPKCAEERRRKAVVCLLFPPAFGPVEEIVGQVGEEVIV